jgi:hypothetical protein
MIILMKHRFAPLAVGILLLAQSGIALPPDPNAVALISKVVLDVSRREVGKDWENAKKGETLSQGDKVKTGEKSVAVVKFKDNSLVRVRELTELTVTGSMSGSAFSKQVEMKSGVVGFNIKKQLSGEQFQFTSPTSVASIRGTGGSFTTRAAADTLIVTEGVIEFKNNISSRMVMVQAGFTGISRADGSIESRPSTAAEKAAAAQATSGSEQDNELEFELRDGRGNSKKLKINYKD